MPNKNVKLVVFQLFRYGDVVSIPRLGVFRSPCKFRAPSSEVDSIKNTLKGLGYTEGTDYVCKVLEDTWTDPERTKDTLIQPDKDTMNLNGQIDGRKFV